ncbi:dihydrolipoyl dehydrogenase [Chromohalobacter japonicus]|uniref:Dihydrolipoyl dehydrogenase n=1 Tax=Chromohalobacter japonicus TaxID=223900 RepID=A0A1Q8TA42_9GAMM|nr:dihydrolipoyl dehydrogenase [Chromohalobacter japonicus]OLO10488.1 dihydrolipoyl dehydrogenase [Chromohalobacter japonicus]
MQEHRFEVAIIGAGSAGLAAWHAARNHTDSVALIEGGTLGTTCAWAGCMPSKLLIAAANTAHHARHVEPFGIRLDSDVRVDGEAVMTRVRQERDRFVGHVFESMDSIPDPCRYRGMARFEGAHTLLIDDDIRLTAERIIIAAGSRPAIPEPFEIAGDRIVTSDTLFEWRTLPESVAVFGPGTTGLELGQALSRLGVRVRLFGQHGSLGVLTDEKVTAQCEGLFNGEFYLDTCGDAEIVEHNGEQVMVRFTDRHSNETMTEPFDHALIATGRKPNVDRLELQRAGLALDERSMPEVDRHTLRCRNVNGEFGHIYMAGDIVNDAPILHEATDEGSIAGDNAGRGNGIYAAQRRSSLGIVFCEPQMARIGPGHVALVEQYGDKLSVSEFSYENQGRARIMEANRGYLRLYGEYGSGRFLGAELCAPAGEHMAHLLAWAHQQGLTVPEMVGMPFYHPTLEEGLRTALRDLSTQLLLAPERVNQCMECGPGA